MSKKSEKTCKPLPKHKMNHHEYLPFSWSVQTFTDGFLCIDVPSR